MKALKCFLITVLFALLINSCNNPFNVLNTSEAGSLPAGKGSFSLRIAEPAGRTIMPADAVAFNDESLFYELIFTPTVAGGAQETVKGNYDKIKRPVTLDVGVYRLEVNAYADENYDQLLFSGTAASITIEEGKTTPVEITLQPVLKGGTGTFRWAITLPDSVFSASMEIKQKSSGTLVESIPLNNNEKTGARELPSGFYDVTIIINGNGDYDKKVIIRREILHIYNGRESVYGPLVFTNGQFTGAYTVTLNFGSNETETIIVEHGSSLYDYFNAVAFDIDQYAPPSDAFLYSGVAPAEPGYTFGGWYLDGGFTEGWAEITPITNNITLYPQWKSAENLIDVFGNTGDTNIVNFINNNTTMGSTYTLVIAEDVTLEETLTIKTGVTLTVTSADTTAPSTINRDFEDTNANSGLFIVGDGANLTFKNITIDGQKDNTDFAGNTASLVRVNSSGIFTMNDGAVLRNNRAENGGGVYVASFVGRFAMAGGTISGNEVGENGGAVFVNGTFTMSGGTISGNTAANGGGGVYLASGTFTMNGGTISNNTATNEGGGVFVYSGTFEMSGGTISGNTAISGGGVYVYTSGPFKLGGKAIIKGNKNGNDNNNVFLLDGKSIQIEPPLTESAEIWVTTTTANNGVIVEYGATSGDEQYFRSDVEGGYFIVDGPPAFQLVLKTDLDFKAIDNTAYSVKAKAEEYYDSGNVIIPAWYNGKLVTEIGSGAFSEKQLIQTVTFAAGSQLTSIGDSAFQGCNGLASITLPASVTSINAYTFSNCNSLESITIPVGVTSIGEGAFSGSGLASIIISEGVTSIGDEAFSGCFNLTGINIPASVKTIGNRAFLISEDAPSEEFISVTFAAGSQLESIGEYAFAHNKVISSIEIPASVRFIGDRAFISCDNLADVTLFATTPPTLGTNVFPTTSWLHVPWGYGDTYREAGGNWESYAAANMIVAEDE